MPPIILFFIAILTPFVLLAAFIVPTYAAIVGVCYIVYAPLSGPHPLADKWFDFFTMIEIYQKVLANGLEHFMALPLLHYTLPMIFLPLIGIVTTVMLMRYLIPKLVDIFHIPVGDKH